MNIQNSDSYNIGSVGLSYFSAKCTGYNLINSLKYLQVYSIKNSDRAIRKIEVRSENWGSGFVHITPETVALLAKQLILNSNLLGKKQFDFSEFIHLTILLNHLENDIYHMKYYNYQDKRALIRWFYSQGRYQRYPIHLIGRYYRLFKFIPNHSRELNNMVSQALGLDVFDILIIGISIFISLMERGHFFSEFILNHNIETLNSVLTMDKLNKFLQKFTVTPEAFVHMNSKLKLGFDPLTRFEFNPLWQCPIIDTQIVKKDERYIIPSSNDLIFAITEGTYYKTLDFFRRAGNRNDFSTAFGYLFEAYVGDFIKNHIDEIRRMVRIFGETKYLRGGQRVDSADWIIRAENSVVQIECKKFTTSLEFRAGISNSVKNGVAYVLKTFSEYVHKLYRKKEDLKNRNYNLGEIENFYNIIVTLDEFHFINRFKQDIIDQLPNDQKNELVDFKFHILGCTEFEIFFQFLKVNPDVDIFRLLQLKESKVYYTMRFGDFLEEHFSYNPTEIDFLWQTGDDLFQEVSR